MPEISALPEAPAHSKQRLTIQASQQVQPEISDLARLRIGRIGPERQL